MNLRNIREERDLSQKEVANILNVARSTYTSWEIQTNMIPLPRLLLFCNIFDVSLDYALNLTNTKKYQDMKTNIDYELHKKRLKKIRKENNYTQAKLAKILNTDNGVISRYENGKTLILTSFLIEYAKTFNISCDYLMTRIDEKRPIKKITKEEKITVKL